MARGYELYNKALRRQTKHTLTNLSIDKACSCETPHLDIVSVMFKNMTFLQDVLQWWLHAYLKSVINALFQMLNKAYCKE